MSRPPTSKPRGPCKYYDTPRSADSTAAGFCKRGAQCWFSHTLKGKEKEVIADEDDLCSICFEKPVTYGLLNDCSHIFCITCIKQWRDPANKTDAGAGNTKLCPMCRQPAKFIIPSSKFYPHGEEKDSLLARYMDSMARVPCRYFQRSLAATPSRPFCPFGKDCFYQHRNADGSEHTFDQGVDVSMRRYAAQRDSAPLFAHRTDIFRSLDAVFAETARLGLHPPVRVFPDGESEGEEIQVMRRLERLSLTGQTVASDSDGESDDDGDMPPLERINPANSQDWPLPMMFDSEDDDEMPALTSVSNSSESESEGEEEDEGLEDEGVIERPAVRPFDLEFDPGMEARREMADPVPDLEDSDSDNVGDHEPPFVTDGRGRVVWSSASTPEGEQEGSPERPLPTRGFLGRMFDTFF
ncbi:hypothetical protein FB45DRAFT_925318 [Roridomyces roridus]|uniref:RING-type E3 ubiquitin transferase n=1 Tax=Roridomyces roridus TaxID=1738132 RepID=A0AAD7BJR6_9AGAR|nr:hypothetical protein FB45DRAFT_925318 [Roridomyces roridus]